ncbi:MAG: alpha/beta hydrolase [Firmicutes bacterium]|nr:alpha/beta hydrolase [Bacillota bacterium]
MTISIRERNINYIQYGSGNDIVLLHGWGQNIEMMEPLAKNFKENRITILDFPGFGKSEEPLSPLTIYDYIEILRELLTTLKIENPILIGHSFGGRVAIGYSSKYDVEKLVLFGSPCIRSQKKSKKEVLLKKLKQIPGMNKLGELAKNYIGSEDYKKASPVMRETLVNVVNEDLSECAKKIKCPTLLIWGTLDEAAPIEDAIKLEKILQDGALIKLEGYTHYAYLEALQQVSNILREFFKEVKK